MQSSEQNIIVKKTYEVLELKAIGVSRKVVNIQVFWDVALDTEDGGKYNLSKRREMLTQRQSVTSKNKHRFQDLISRIY